jgi:hypothetical protein
MCHGALEVAQQIVNAVSGLLAPAAPSATKAAVKKPPAKKSPGTKGVSKKVAVET